MRQMLVPGAKKSFRQERETNAISCAEYLAAAFLCDKKHNAFVADVAINMFDKMKKIHGLGSSERLVLHLAALLSGCGRLISARGILEASYDIIKRSEIYGITFRERLYIAHLLRYSAFAAPDLNDAAWRELTNKEQTVVSKLAAIYRLAQALDASGKQKIDARQVAVKDISGKKSDDDDCINIVVRTVADIFLEQYIFNGCTTFFRTVYGLTPVLKVKRLE